MTLMKNSTKANLYFLLVAAIWGATFPLIKLAVKEMNPNLFVCLRFGLAMLVLLPFVLHQFKKVNANLLKAGVLLGVLNSTSYGLQTLGLQTIAASRSAFITGAGVVFVPVLCCLFKLTKFNGVDFLAAFVCLFGIYLLTGANLTALNRGDIFTLIAALAWALTIVFMQKLSLAGFPSLLIAFFQILFTLPLPFVFAAPALTHFSGGSFLAWGVVIFCAILATILPMFLQMRYQRNTTASQAALIFSLEPVFASFYAILFFGEKVSHTLILGGAFILFSTVLPVVLSYRLLK